MKFISGLQEIHSFYEAFIIDLWGVVHDGYALFSSVAECLKELKKANKSVLFLTNSPQRESYLRAHLASLGVTANMYDALHSSGEDTYEHLQDFPPEGLCYALGHPGEFARDPSLKLVFTNDINESSYILATTPACGVVTQYDKVLQQAVARNIPMICVNPDLSAIHGGQHYLCAGSIAQRYEQLGGIVTYHGKPHARVYRRALEKLGHVRPSKVLVIGDSLRTDVAGAHATGMHALLVMSGIEGTALNIGNLDDLPEEKIIAYCQAKGLEPDYIGAGLRW
jgi:HAD superfamily hydrolase (TIGR01459 family)